MIKLDIDGLEELESEWQAAVNRIGRGLAGAAGRAADAGAEAARRNHRFQNQSGDLEQSILGRIVQVSPLGGQAEIAADAPHAAFVEARLPFMEIAEVTAERILRAEAEEAVEQALARVRAR